MNFSKRRGESRPSGRVRPRRSVGTRGGCGDGWGPCACPGEWRFRQGCMLTHWSSSPGRGQAQGPLIHPTPPLVPTGRLTSLAAFGRQNSLGLDLAGDEELSSAFEPCLIDKMTKRATNVDGGQLLAVVHGQVGIVQRLGAFGGEGSHGIDLLRCEMLTD